MAQYKCVSSEAIIWKRRITSLTGLSTEQLQRLHHVKQRICTEFNYEEPDAEDLIVEVALASNLLM